MSKVKLLTNSMDPNTSLGWVERISYGLGNGGNAVVYGFVSLFLTYFYTDTMGLNAGVIGTIFLVSRLLDGVTDLIMGGIVDRTNSRKGKGRVWVLRLCIPYAIGGVLLFTVPDAGPMIQYVYVFMSYNVVNSIIYTGLAVPFNSMTALLTQNPYDRGLLGIFTMVSSVFVGILMSSSVLTMVANFGGGRTAWIMTASIWAVVGLACHLACYFGCRERVVDAKTTVKDDVSFLTSLKALIKNSYWIKFTIVTVFIWLSSGLMQTSLVYFVDSVLGNTNLYSMLYNAQSISQFVFLMVSAVLIVKIGKVKCFQIGIIIDLAGMIVRVAFSTNITMQIVSGLLVGMGSGFAGAVMAGIMADIVDYGHWKTGIKSVGLCMATNSFGQKVGYGLASSLWGLILSWGGYDGTAAVQSESALLSIKFGYMVLPTICIAIILVLMARFPLDKEMPKVREDLTAGACAADAKEA